MDVTLITDLQFGSTGKGLICGYLAHHSNPDGVAAAWGPNAGHTYIDHRGVKYVTTMLPIGAIASTKCKSIFIGPGATLDVKALMAEVQYMVANHAGAARKINLFIHPQATMLMPRHKDSEAAGSNVRIGSTMKGTGAALIEKIKRDPDGPSPLVRHNLDDRDFQEMTYRFHEFGITVYAASDAYMEGLSSVRTLQVEGAQGFGLGIHRDFWPYATSREVTPAQILSDCAMFIPKKMQIVGTIRTYPIRVSNRFDAAGVQIGTSGPVYDDQRELDWSEIGVEPELTTVTKLQRRIFTMSYRQLLEASEICRPDMIFLNFANYVKDKATLQAMIEDVEYASGSTVGWIGYGPSIRHVVRADGTLR